MLNIFLRQVSILSVPSFIILYPPANKASFSFLLLRCISFALKTHSVLEELPQQL